jgi:Hemopexin
MPSIDAIVYWPLTDKAYFFRGSDYVRYRLGGGGEKAEEKVSLREHRWTGLAFEDRIDAAATVERDNQVYFFRGDRFVPYRIARRDDEGALGQPVPIAARFPALPPHYQRDLDAVLFWPDNGRLYFFKGGAYLDCDPVSGLPLQSERALPGDWNGLPFDRIDAAFVGKRGKAYFFRGEHYVAYSVGEDKTTGPAQPWKDHWPARRSSPGEKSLWELLSETPDVPQPSARPARAIKPKLALYQDIESKPVDRQGFLNLATAKAKQIGAIGDPRFEPGFTPQVGPTRYRTGEDLVTRVADAARCLAQPVDEIWIYGHGGPRGIFSAYNTFRGLYVRMSLLAKEDMEASARTVLDVPTEMMAPNVVIIFASCGAGFPVLGHVDGHRVAPDKYGPEVEDHKKGPGLAEDLLKVLLDANLQFARIYGIGGTGGYVEFSAAHKSGAPGVPSGPSPLPPP